MPVFSANCPRCGTRRVMFQLMENTATAFDECEYDMFARCNLCNRGVVATYSTINAPLEYHIDIYGPDEISPSVPDTGPPSHTPKNVARYYRQGMENLADNPDAAGAMFRKTLEVALKEKFPGRGKMSLAKRITAAAEAGNLTSDLADWAHQIRIDGNDAAHDEITGDQVQDMQVFTELVLRYLFELPGMLKEAQQRISKDKDNTGV